MQLIISIYGLQLVLLIRIQDLGILVYRDMPIPSATREQPTHKRYPLLNPRGHGGRDAEQKVWHGRQRRERVRLAPKGSVLG